MIKKSALATLWLILALLPLHALAAAPRPARIVSLTPAITEMLFAIGLGKEVVGVSEYSTFPPAAQKIMPVGGVQVNYERVVALRPTLIVGDQVATAGADARLKQIGLRVLAVDPISINTIESSLLQIGAATGHLLQAHNEVAHMEAVRLEAHRIAVHAQNHPKTLLLVGTNPLYVAGRGTFMSAVLLEAGGVNAAQMSGYGTLSEEWLIAHPPILIVADRQDQAALEKNPVLRLLPAVRNRRFVAIPSDLLQRPGPRIVNGLLLLTRALHPGVR